MTVTEVKQGLGSFTVGLRPTAPQTVLDLLDQYFGHVAIVEGRVNPALYGDQLLTSARYVGVYRSRRNDVDNRTQNVDGKYELSGVGMAYWLGDENGKGPVYELPEVFSASSFASTIAALLPGAVQAGTLHTVAGTYSQTHQWVTPRQAINYVCSTFNAEWRVNGDATLDAGTVAQLYPATPTTMLVKRGYGRDVTVTGYQGKMDSGEDAEEFSSRVVVLGRGTGESIATGSADVGFNPYKDRFGNPVQVTRLVSESTTDAVNADARAAVELAEVSGTRRALRLAADDFDISGPLRVGHWVWVYDPDTGLYDTANEIAWRGDRLNPAKHRCVELTWPVHRGMTVAFRDLDGGWHDLTDHVVWEAGDVTIVVGELPRSLTGGRVEQVGTRPSADTSTPDAPNWNTPFSTSTYPDGLGITKAQILLSWDLPLNTDGSTILDGDHYEIAYGIHPASEWQTAYAAWGTLTLLVQELSPGVEYDIRIRAVDLYGHAGAWSATEAVTVAPDTTPPSTPAAPTVAGSRIAIQVTHTLGKASGGTYNLEVDLNHFEVHVGASSGFTPDNSTLVGKLPATVGMMLALVPAVGTFQVEDITVRHVKVVAVDCAGNASPSSTSATATALLIDDAHISDLTVSKVTAGTVSANWLLAASIRTAASGARVEVNASGIQAFNAGGVQTVTIANSGTFTIQTAASGARVVIDGNGVRAFNSGGTQTVDIASATGNVTIQGEVRSAASGERIVFNPAGASDPEIRFYPSSGSSFSRVFGDDSFSTASITMESGATASNNARSRLTTAPDQIIMTSFLLSLTASSMIRTTANGALLFNGRVGSSGTGDDAMNFSRATVSGTSGTIVHGVVLGTPVVVSQMRAGNVAAYTQTNVTTATFNWGWAGPGLSAGSDFVHYVAART